MQIRPQPPSERQRHQYDGGDQHHHRRHVGVVAGEPIEHRCERPVTDVARTTPSLTPSRPQGTGIVRGSGAAILPTVAVISDIVAPLAAPTIPVPAILLRVYDKNSLRRKDHQLKPAPIMRPSRLDVLLEPAPP